MIEGMIIRSMAVKSAAARSCQSAAAASSHVETGWRLTWPTGQPWASGAMGGGICELRRTLALPVLLKSA